MEWQRDLHCIAVGLRRKYVWSRGAQFAEGHPYCTRSELRQNVAHRKHDIHSGNHRLFDSRLKLQRQHGDNGWQ
jgi:hypothetical protein